MTKEQILARSVLQLAIIPALEALGMGGIAACELVLGTGIQESKLIYRKQLGNGPALGLFQMEPTTFWDIWNRFVEPQRSLEKTLLTLCDGRAEPQAMVKYDIFAAAMCRLHYRRFPDPLPPDGNIQAHADYWKRHYNTYLGAGKPQQFVIAWNRYMGCMDISTLMNSNKERT